MSENIYGFGSYDHSVGYLFSFICVCLSRVDLSLSFVLLEGQYLPKGTHSRHL